MSSFISQHTKTVKNFSSGDVPKIRSGHPAHVHFGACHVCSCAAGAHACAIARSWRESPQCRYDSFDHEPEIGRAGAIKLRRTQS